MKLLDYLKINNKGVDYYDADYYDSDYQVSITVCFMDNNIENLDIHYDTFCKKLYSCVQIKNENTVFWADLIINNMELFREFTRKRWLNFYENDDGEFVCQWLKDLHLLCSGDGWNSIYIEVSELLDKCKYIERKEGMKCERYK